MPLAISSALLRWTSEPQFVVPLCRSGACRCRWFRDHGNPSCSKSTPATKVPIFDHQSVLNRLEDVNAGGDFVDAPRPNFLTFSPPHPSCPPNVPGVDSSIQSLLSHHWDHAAQMAAPLPSYG